MMIESRWILVYNPLGASPITIVQPGDMLSSEPEFEITRGLEVIRIPGGAPFLRPTAEDLYRFSFDVAYAKSSDAEARREMLNHLILRYAFTGKTAFQLLFQGRETGEAWNFTAGFITAARVRRLVNQGPLCGWGLRLQVTAVGASPA
jgi:hypothetical protein